jgi:hypothetical protein
MKIYPYYEIKEKVDSFTNEYGDLMTNERWTIESRPCSKSDLIFDKSARTLDERFVYTTLLGDKKVNNDYLFVKRGQTGKSKKSIHSKLLKYGFEIDENGLIFNVKNAPINSNNEPINRNN